MHANCLGDNMSQLNRAGCCVAVQEPKEVQHAGEVASSRQNIVGWAQAAALP